MKYLIESYKYTHILTPLITSPKRFDNSLQNHLLAIESPIGTLKAN